MGGRPYNEDALISAYEVLASRYASTTSFQWQVPAFGVTAQAALLTGVVTTGDRLGAFILAGVSVIIALATMLTTRRVELTAWWDRSMMDRYEKLLIPKRLRLHHRLNLRDRHKRQALDSNFTKGSKLHEWQIKLVMLAPPSLILSIALVAVSASSVTVAFLKHDQPPSDRGSQTAFSKLGR